MNNTHIPFILDKDISHLSNFKTKAISKYYFEIHSDTDILLLKDIYDFSQYHKLKLLILWAGTNMLFGFDVFDGIIVKNYLQWFSYDTKTSLLEVSTAEMITDIAWKLEHDFGQDLWHRFIWLPGSVWGAIFWNAGCFWLETESNFLKAEVLHIPTWERKIFFRDEINFSYRSSLFKDTQEYFIIKAWFDLSQKREKYSSDVDNIKFREEIQPKWNSCGSFFKNPSRDASAGKLIEEVWLKWYTYGSAYFSQKHANFLMTNTDNWDYKDLLFLINLAQKKVYENFMVDLIPEVRIIQNNP